MGGGEESENNKRWYIQENNVSTVSWLLEWCGHVGWSVKCAKLTLPQEEVAGLDLAGGVSSFSRASAKPHVLSTIKTERETSSKEPHDHMYSREVGLTSSCKLFSFRYLDHKHL